MSFRPSPSRSPYILPFPIRPCLPPPLGVRGDGLHPAAVRGKRVAAGMVRWVPMLLFSSLDVRGTGFVVPADVSAWFDAEHAFHEKRSASRMKRTKNPARGTRIAAQHALKSFKVFLRSKWRYLFHAWRAKLDRDGSMTVARKELWKTCAELGWHGDVNALWHSLDSDDSGSCTLDEFTVAEARPLAIFRRAAVERYGSVLRQFRALLSAAKVKGPGGRLSRAAWGAASTKLGCQYDAPVVFDLLDWQEAGSLCMRDLRWMDAWAPAAWLAEQPDPEAAADFKRALLQKYGGSVVKAWRLGLDRDSTGTATFKEVQLAAQKIGFGGNVAAAFLAMDSEMCGCVALDALSPEAAQELMRFRHWAFQMFGCVLLAFQALDADRSDSISWREFRKAMRTHAYKGDLEALFSTLDGDGGGTISKAEVAFLDDWCEPLSLRGDDGGDAQRRPSVPPGPPRSRSGGPPGPPEDLPLEVTDPH
ncbi:unnamed protein product [Prorocentrum cordatum]|uniref:EF-hand domain-containing protein n=1 Tax=Prorocentrum cordatum TaxID=2364126 RepID=A0ABN9U752_9DINO|nr:unnamed protein product [Polarella glacialis]